MEEEEEANLARFLQWATALGISDSSGPGSPSSSCLGCSLRVSHFPEAGGRGLAAARDLAKGELVLRVPKAALMTSDCLISSDQKFSAAFGKFQLLSPAQRLCIALLNEVNKGRSSWWYPYLKQLPQSYDLLAGFAQFEIEALQKRLFVKVKQSGKKLLQFYQNLISSLSSQHSMHGYGFLQLYPRALCMYPGILRVVYVLLETSLIMRLLTKMIIISWASQRILILTLFCT